MAFAWLQLRRTILWIQKYLRQNVCDSEALKYVEIYLNPENTGLLSNNILNVCTEYSSQLRKFVKFCFAFLWNNTNSSL